jgi:hypothetical protein
MVIAVTGLMRDRKSAISAQPAGETGNILFVLR